MADKNQPQLGMVIKDKLTVGDAPAVTSKVNNLAAMSKAVKESGVKNGVAEDFSPAIKALVRSNDDGSFFIKFGNEGEKEISLSTGNRQVSKLICDEQVALFEPSQAILRF